MENNPRFSISVGLTKDAYREFNEFMIFRSPYNKGILSMIRILPPVVIALLFIYSVIVDGFNSDTLYLGIGYALFVVLYEIIIPRSLRRSIGRQIDKMGKSEKLLYSANSELEFWDESFTEQTESTKSEFKYTTVDRISIVGERVIYIHFNKMMACIVPVDSIGGDEEKIAFVSFLREKCDRIDVYK